MKKITVPLVKSRKNGEKLTMVTAYDAPTAALLERGGIELILVGDSMGNVVLGHENTVPVTMEDIIHHTRAVSRGASKPLLVADMPFMSYHQSPEHAIANAGRLMKEGRAEAVKLEGGTEFAPTVKFLVDRAVPVMGHIGLTPQSISKLGGYRVQGKKATEARELLAGAQALAEAGAFALVLECVPDRVAALITEKVDVPTIGIGAGSQCDGQVLVFHDMMNLDPDFSPKFVKHFANLSEVIIEGLQTFAREVKSQTYPGEEHSFSISDEEYEKISEE